MKHINELWANSDQWKRGLSGPRQHRPRQSGARAFICSVPHPANILMSLKYISSGNFNSSILNSKMKIWIFVNPIFIFNFHLGNLMWWGCHLSQKMKIPGCVSILKCVTSRKKGIFNSIKYLFIGQKSFSLGWEANVHLMWIVDLELLWIEDSIYLWKQIV